MDDNLREASEQGNVEKLYKLIKQDPDVLESINNKRFAHTPLHEAASKGHTMFMLEVMRLMPSFGKKLNPDGFSPLHLALQSPDDRTPTIRQLIRANRDVIRVKGRMGMTALHWVAQSGDINLLLEFLKACPESIEDLTDKFETALHVAVKNRMVDAVKVIVEWLRYGCWGIYRDRILNLKNHEGNTALHAAVLSEEPQILIVKALSTPPCRKNLRNLEGKTALDVLNEKQGQMNPHIAGEIRKVLRNPIGPWLDKLGWFYHLEIMTEDARKALLVVAVLIATATYQVGLNPPDALLHPMISRSSYQQISSFSDFLLSLNHILLYYSIFTIVSLLPPEPTSLRKLLASLLWYMGLCYMCSILVIMPRLPSKIVSGISFGVMSAYIFAFVTSNPIRESSPTQFRGPQGV